MIDINEKLENSNNSNENLVSRQEELINILKLIPEEEHRETYLEHIQAIWSPMSKGQLQFDHGVRHTDHGIGKHSEKIFQGMVLETVYFGSYAYCFNITNFRK